MIYSITFTIVKMEADEDRTVALLQETDINLQVQMNEIFCYQNLRTIIASNLWHFMN